MVFRIVRLGPCLVHWQWGGCVPADGAFAPPRPAHVVAPSVAASECQKNLRRTASSAARFAASSAGGTANLEQEVDDRLGRGHRTLQVELEREGAVVEARIKRPRRHISNEHRDAAR